MKKLILACSVLLLASCTEPEKESVESETKIETSTEEQQAEQKGQQEQVSIAPNQLGKEQLSKVMADLANEFDFLPTAHTFYDSPHTIGLIYAELFDANADGQEELYVLIKSNSYISDQLLHRSYPGYIQEIWQANQDGDEATLLHYQLVEDSAIEGQTSAVMNSGLDGREFTIDLKVAPQAMSNVMTQLNTNMNSYSIEGQAADGEALVQVENVLNDLKMFHSIDTRNSNAHENLATALILYGFVENDAPYYSYFVGFKEESIFEEMKKRFNITLTSADINLPEPAEDDPSNFFTYKDGVFYIPPSDHYRNEVFRNIEQVVKVSDSVYYARLHDIRFDSMNYMMGEDDPNFDSSKYANTVIEDWPEETKPFLTQALPMYAVVKMVDDEAKLLYQGYLDLTDEELESF